jgi:hypothetical protein
MNQPEPLTLVYQSQGFFAAKPLSSIAADEILSGDIELDVDHRMGFLTFLAQGSLAPAAGTI